MSSLAPYSLGTCLGSLHPKTSSNYSAAKSSHVVFSNYHNDRTFSVQPLPLLQNETNPTTQFKRRDAIGLTLSFSLLHVFFQPQPTSAAEAVPCELTVAPSGLAFCDKFVGTGPQAVKGQLIKVSILHIGFNLCVRLV